MNVRTYILDRTKRVAGRVGQLTHNSVYRFVQYFILGISVLFVVLDPFLHFTALLTHWAFGKGFAFCWIWGVIGGHLFLIRKETIINEFLAIAILCIVSLILLCVACFCNIDGNWRLNSILLIAGCIAGHLLWPQNLHEGQSRLRT